MVQDKPATTLFCEGCLSSIVSDTWSREEGLGCHRFSPQHQHGGTSESRTGAPSGGGTCLHQTLPLRACKCLSKGARLTLIEPERLSSRSAQPLVPGTKRQLFCVFVYLSVFACQSVSQFVFVLLFLSFPTLFLSSFGIKLIVSDLSVENLYIYINPILFLFPELLQ